MYDVRRAPRFPATNAWDFISRPSIKNVSSAAPLFPLLLMKKFESLAAFATEDRIIRLIAKERGKYTAKVPEKTPKKKVQEGEPKENPSEPL